MAKSKSGRGKKETTAKASAPAAKPGLHPQIKALAEFVLPAVNNLNVRLSKPELSLKDAEKEILRLAKKHE